MNQIIGRETFEEYSCGVKFRAITLIMLFFLTGCSIMPTGESAEELVEKGCKEYHSVYDSVTASYFFEASKMDYKYRDLTRAYVSLTSAMKTVSNEKADFGARRVAALRAQDELAILTSYCGP